MKLYFSLLAAFTVVIPAAIGILNFRYHGKDQHALTGFMVLSVLTEIYATTFALLKQNNFPALHVFTLIEFCSISYIYGIHIRKLIPVKILVSVAVLFCLGSIANSLFIQSIYSFNSYARGIEFILILLYTLMYIYILADRENGITLNKDPMFWITIAVIIYYASSFFVVLMINNVLRQSNVIWQIHNVFLMLHYFLFSRALWIRQTR